MTGVYKIYQKAKPTKFKIVGTANFEAYWSKNGDKTLAFTLLRECNKVELPGFTKHFLERFKPTWDDKEVKQVVVEEPEIKTAIKPEPKQETAVIKEAKITGTISGKDSALVNKRSVIKSKGATKKK